MGFWSWLSHSGPSHSALSEVQSARYDRDLFVNDAKCLVKAYFDSHRPRLFYSQLFGYEHDIVNEDGYIEFVSSSPECITGTGLDFAIKRLRHEFQYMYFENWRNTFKSYHASMLPADVVASVELVSERYKKEAFFEAFEENKSEIGSFAVDLVLDRREADVRKLTSLLEEKWPYLKSILRNALLAGVDRYGEQDYELFHKECSLFTSKFMPEDSLAFYDSTLVWVKMASIAMAKLDELPVVSSREVPIDGVEFEVWCAERFIELGWDVQMTAATGDQGVDLIVRRGMLSIAVQCKRYSQPVGNKAVQEAYAGQQHVGADYACVIATAGFTKAAKELARSTNVHLIEVGNIDAFSDSFSGQTGRG